MAETTATIGGHPGSIGSSISSGNGAPGDTQQLGIDRANINATGENAPQIITGSNGSDEIKQATGPRAVPLPAFPVPKGKCKLVCDPVNINGTGENAPPITEIDQTTGPRAVLLAAPDEPETKIHSCVKMAAAASENCRKIRRFLRRLLCWDRRIQVHVAIYQAAEDGQRRQWSLWLENSAAQEPVQELVFGFKQPAARGIELLFCGWIESEDVQDAVNTLRTEPVLCAYSHTWVVDSIKLLLGRGLLTMPDGALDRLESKRQEEIRPKWVNNGEP